MKLDLRPLLAGERLLTFEYELKLEIDTEISPVVSYFEIFLKRMIMCRKAAAKLGLSFKLVVNNQQLM